MEVGTIVKAIYDFSTEDEQELILQVGDIIQVTQRVDKQWSHGISNQKEGNFPLNYTIELKIPHYKENQQIFAPISDFVAQELGDLSFRKGDLVIGIRAIDENWWEGELNGDRGIFPLTHVWKIDHSLLPKTTEPKRIQLKARVKMNMKAQLKDEMDLTKDEIVLITEEVDKGWYRGMCNQRSGIFPASFVTIIEEENDNIRNTSQNDFLNMSNGNVPHINVPDPSLNSSDQYGYDCLNSGIAAYGRTIYPFQSDYPNELSFNEGEIVNLIRHVDEKWMEGEIDGKIGLFPTDFVNIIVDCPGDSLTGTNTSQSSEDVQFPADTYGRVLSLYLDSDSRLTEGDTVTLIQKIDGNLYEVLTDNGESVICPANSIEVIGSGPDAFPPSYSDVMKDNSVYVSTSENLTSRKNFPNNSSRSDRPMSYPSTSFDQSSFVTPSSHRHDLSMKSFCSVDDKIAENLVGLNTSQTSESGSNFSLMDRSYSLSSDSGYSGLDKSNDFRGRLTSSPLPTLTTSTNGSPFNNWNDSASPSYANLSNSEYSNIWEESSETPEISRRPPSPTNHKRKSLNKTASSSFSRHSSIVSENGTSDLAQQLSEREEQLKQTKAFKTKLENQIKGESVDNNFVNTEIQQHIVQLEKKIQRLNCEVTELKTKTPVSRSNSIIASNDNPAEREAEVVRKRELEEKRRAVEKKKKMKEQRNCVITELLQTERDYLSDLRMLHNTFEPIEAKAKGIDVVTLVGNLDEVIHVASQLLRRLEKTSRPNSQHQMIGESFVDMADEMKEVYGHYCRNHDDVIATLDKYGETSPAGLYLRHKVETLKRQTNCFDLKSMLIKPVQRILKYPLLLNELVKCTDDNDPDKQQLIKAIGLMTDVATAINEFKRRKDLVFKYRKHADTSLSGRISKFSLHSMLKKSSRFGIRISKTIGLTSDVKDEGFSKLERQFHALEKSIKIFMKDINAYMEKQEELVKTGFRMAEDVADLYEERKSQPEVDCFRSVHRITVTQFWEAFKQNIDRNVLSFLKQLLAMFVGPNNLIQKRYDKLLDYLACTNKLEKNKDATKIKMLQDNQNAAKNVYEALNSQLLDDLPKLYSTSIEVLHDNIRYFLKAKKNFIKACAREMEGLKELPLLLGSQSGILETFQVKHTIVTDNLCHMAIVPKQLFPSGSGTLKRNSSPRRSTLSFGVASPSATKSAQTSSHVVFVKSSYPVSALCCSSRDYLAADLLDLSLKKGDIVGVIKKKDPMGGNMKWFVDNGVAKGFVPATYLVQFKPETVDVLNPWSSPPAQTHHHSSGKANIANPKLPCSDNVPRNPQTRNSSNNSFVSPEPNRPRNVPVRPAPPVNRTVLRSNQNNIPNRPRPQSNINPAMANIGRMPNETDTAKNLVTSPELHRYEEIDDLSGKENRYDLVTQDESSNYQSQTDSRSTKTTVDEFDPYGPVSPTNSQQLYDNVPSDVTSPMSHRYEIIPDGNEVTEEYYYSLYDFAPTGPNQMRLSKGQVVLVLEKCDRNLNQEWWYVEDRHGNKGYAPQNYLKTYSSTAVLSP